MKTADDVSKAYHEGYEQGRFDAIADIPHGIEKGYSVVAVVRCKECEDYNTIGCSKGFGWCENMDMGVSDDFYCANGAKITNKETGETYK